MASKIFDATSFYAGIPFSSQERGFTTSQIFEEIKHIKKHQGAISVLIESKRLVIIDPEQKFIDTILQKAKEVGDLPSLSKEDISVLALSLQLNGELITDDFAVTNTAKHLNLVVLPIMTRGAVKTEWIYYCSGCERSFSKVSVCPICGNKLKRNLAQSKSSANQLGK